jgi:hypothetical protein
MSAEYARREAERNWEYILATRKQIEANRRNAQKSTGPKTEAGKQIVSRNAITHGLTSARAGVLPEEQEEYDRLSEALHFELGPEGAMERLLVGQILQQALRLKRAARIETSVLLGIRQAVQGAEAADAQTLGRAYSAAIPVLNTLARNERHIERSFQRARQELELLRFAREALVSDFYARKVGKLPPAAINRRQDRQFHRDEVRIHQEPHES